MHLEGTFSLVFIISTVNWSTLQCQIESKSESCAIQQRKCQSTKSKRTFIVDHEINRVKYHFQ